MAQKLYVQKVRGAGNAVGSIDPVIGMNTQLGPITATPYNSSVSGNIVEINNSTSGNYREHNHGLFITEAAAIASFSFPSGSTCSIPGHKNFFSGTQPVATNVNYITMLSPSGLMKYQR